MSKLERDIKQLGLGLLLFGEWYNEEAMGKMGFFDDNTRSWWTPATGGPGPPHAHAPAAAALVGGVAVAHLQLLPLLLLLLLLLLVGPPERPS